MDKEDKEILWQILIKYQKDYPELTLINEGFEYLSKDIRNKYKNQISKILTIIKKVLPDITEFNNFYVTEKEFLLRCQGKWSDTYIGVYYIGKDYFIYSK